MEERKNPKKDLRKKAVLFFNVGLVLSMAAVISAFEWRSYDVEGPLVFADDLKLYQEEWMPPVSVQKEAEPPKPQERPEYIDKIIEVPDDTDLEELKKQVIIDIPEPTPSPVPVEVMVPEPEKVEEKPFDIVETMPEPVEGMEEFLKSVGKKMKYPSPARRAGADGRVFVQFTVDKDGTLTDIKAIRGIGFGCDEEAVRVIKMSPKWKPGKQRGRAVQVRMVLPITFALD